MSKLPQVKPARLIRALQRAGFYIDHITGSHHFLFKEGHTRPVSVPRHSRDLKRGTLDGILKRAGLTATQLKNLL